MIRLCLILFEGIVQTKVESTATWIYIGRIEASEVGQSLVREWWLSIRQIQDAAADFDVFETIVRSLQIPQAVRRYRWAFAIWIELLIFMVQLEGIGQSETP